MIKLLIIGSGGFLGAVFRYFLITGVTAFTERISGVNSFPFGTLAVNIVGCFLIGFLGGLIEYKQLFSSEVRLFLFIGLLGGFTTYSTFGYDAYNLLREGRSLSMAIYIAGHLGPALFAVWGGHYISKFF